MDRLCWTDRVYGPTVIDDPAILGLIATPTFQRLKGIKQAGPSAMAFPFKVVTRFEHSVGVHLLLRRLGADRREQVAGLLHDVSHTAFSHAVDFLFASEEQDHHERLKPDFLHRPDLAEAIRRLGYMPEEFEDDSVYPLLEQPLPSLCADRVDYFLRDSLTCGVSTPAWVKRALDHLAVGGRTIAFTDPVVATEAVERFALMNRDWWASPTESYIYNEFADALREGFRLGVLDRAALAGDDAEVLARLRSARNPLIDDKLEAIARFDPARLVGFSARVIPKVRWLDPHVVRPGGGLVRLSSLTPAGATA